MTTTTISTTITGANNPFTLLAGDTISVSSELNDRAGEAIYTSFSGSNATTLGGPTIVIDGVVLDSSGQVNPDEYAIQSKAAADVTIDNFGIISASSLVAVGINNGLIINELGSTISGTGGIRIGTGSLGSTIINEGTVLGSSLQGIDFLEPGTASGMITNINTGLVRGGLSGGAIDETGIYIDSGTISNAGTISQGGAAGYSIDFFDASGHDGLILDPGQVLKGIAKAAGVDNYITLAGTGPGTLSNPGNYIGWSLISVAEWAEWQIGTAGAGVSVSGVHTIDLAGTLDVLGTIIDTDFNMSGTGGVVDFTAPLSTAGGSLFNGNTLGTITNFGAGDSFIVGPTVLVTQPGDDIITDYNTATGVYQIIDASRPNLPNDYVNITVTGTGAPNGLTADNFTYTSGPGGFTVSEVACFGMGTALLTPDGMVAVENLQAGDLVLSASDGEAKEILWAGRRRIDLTRHANPEKVMPVRIRAGALAAGLPERDLVVSPDHALLMDGYLVEAKTLVNGATILWDRACRSVTYYHIELAKHDVVLAEGMPAETYLEDGNRTMFEGAASRLHPDFTTVRRDGGCAPLLLDGDGLRAIRQLLLERAVALGFAITGEVDLMAEAGGRRMAPAGHVGASLWFELPEACETVTLLSSAGVPAEISAAAGDRRKLGVAVAKLVLTDADGRREIDLDEAAEGGFHAAEPGQRWTDGAGRVRLPAYRGRALLDVTINGQAARWRRAAARLVA